MASIVTGILSSTLGLLLNKVRDMTADKLKDGDIADARIREIVVRDLNDVKAKIDGLSRSHLFTSCNFLQDGVNLLKACLDKSEAQMSEAKSKAVLSETQGDGGETSTKPSDVGSAILTKALILSQAMGKVRINSDKEFETAIKRFEDARKEATRAFCNEALSVKDRIFAAKLRIVSELLECLESPETAVANCLPFLGTFHSLPAIREIFSVYINDGVKAKVSKAERLENVKSVMLINHVLFQFVWEFSSKYCSAMTWPAIELGDRSFRPILDWKEVSTRRTWGEEFIQPPNQVIVYKERAHFCSAVNSRGEIVRTFNRWHILVTSITGKVMEVRLSYPEDGKVVQEHFDALAVDCNNNIYVVIRTHGYVLEIYVLYVFDANYNVKQNCKLPFLDPGRIYRVEIAINKNSNIIIMDSSHDVYVCDNGGKLIHKFKPDTSYERILTTSDNNEIMLASKDREAVHRYTEEGDLESTIRVPEGHLICGVAFHHVICKIMVLTEMKHSYLLLCYSETGELESTTFLCKEYELELPYIRSHPSGPVVLDSGTSLTFI